MAPRQRKLYLETESLLQYSRLSQIKKISCFLVMRSGDDERFFVCEFLKQPGGMVEKKKMQGCLVANDSEDKSQTKKNLDAAR